MTVCGCFGLGTARIKALGALKKKMKMTKLDFHRFQVQWRNYGRAGGQLPPRF